jgi:hypothetical protein
VPVAPRQNVEVEHIFGGIDGEDASSSGPHEDAGKMNLQSNYTSATKVSLYKEWKGRSLHWMERIEQVARMGTSQYWNGIKAASYIKF